MEITRRTALRGGLAGLTTIALDGGTALFSPRKARASGRPLHVLTPLQASTLEALGDRLAIGAAEEGVTYFVDDQLRKPAADVLLLVRYLGIDPPYDHFYVSCLAALEASSRAIYSLPFKYLSDSQRDSMIGTLATGNPQGWTSGIPAPLFYFAARSDAVDVVYGTIEGFHKLGIPYMPHIVPPRSW